jgi:hypothetical protein
MAKQFPHSCGFSVAIRFLIVQLEKRISMVVVVGYWALGRGGPYSNLWIAALIGTTKCWIFQQLAATEQSTSMLEATDRMITGPLLQLLQGCKCQICHCMHSAIDDEHGSRQL